MRAPATNFSPEPAGHLGGVRFPSRPATRPVRSSRALHPLARVLVCAVCALGAPIVVGCGAPQSRAAADLAKLPEYKGKDKELFDDSFDVSIAGLSMDKPIYKGDVRFRDRCQAADSIAKVKLTTVTIDKLESRSIFQLQLRVVERLGGPQTPPETVDVTIKEGDPAYGLMLQSNARLRGKTMVALWKRFRQNEEQAMHFVFAPDDPEVVAAVQEAIALSELKK